MPTRHPQHRQLSLSSKVHKHSQMHTPQGVFFLLCAPPPSFAKRALGKPEVRLIQCVPVCCGNHTVSVFLLADSSSCCISGWCPVPRLSCPGVRLSLRNSGKPRVAVGRLWPRMTSSSAPWGLECWSHSGSDVIPQCKQAAWRMWQLLLRLMDEQMSMLIFQSGIKMRHYFCFHWAPLKV